MDQKWITILLLLLVLTLSACVHQSNGTEPVVPDEDYRKTDQVWVDYDTVKIFIMESYPMQVDLFIQGDLPTPCHELKWEILDPDENNAIHIHLYSKISPEESCVQRLEPFEARISLGDFREGGYSVWINDVMVGEF